MTLPSVSWDGWQQGVSSHVPPVRKAIPEFAAVRCAVVGLGFPGADGVCHTHRSALIHDVLAAETRGGQPLALGDAIGELLADITEAVRTIGTILQQAAHGSTRVRA